MWSNIYIFYREVISRLNIHNRIKKYNRKKIGNCKTNFIVCWPHGPSLKTEHIFNFGRKPSFDEGQYSLLQTLVILLWASLGPPTDAHLTVVSIIIILNDVWNFLCFNKYLPSWLRHDTLLSLFISQSQALWPRCLGRPRVLTHSIAFIILRALGKTYS